MNKHESYDLCPKYSKYYSTNCVDTIDPVLNLLLKSIHINNFQLPINFFKTPHVHIINQLSIPVNIVDIHNVKNISLTLQPLLSMSTPKIHFNCHFPFKIQHERL